MKTILLVCAALCIASSAFAITPGVDIAVGACAGDAGALSNAGALDCAGGGVLTLLVTFVPAEDYTDLAAADCIFEIRVGGDVTGPANFWDFQVANASALGGTGARPSTGCDDYTNLFNVPDAGFAVGGLVRGPDDVRLASTAFRPFGVHEAALSRQFASQITIDAGTSVEAGRGGTVTGCSTSATIWVDHLLPGASGNPTILYLPSLSPGYVMVSGGDGLPVPATRHSWGALKSLYR
jgi:hypothetical protein